MREIGPAKPPPGDPGEVFYTIRPEDRGKTVIDTEIGPVSVGSVIGCVLREDVGKRLYRVRVHGTHEFIWQAENGKQLRERQERERESH